jgi:regulator of sigma E protease
VAILVAGPLMNFVFAVVAFWAMFIAGVPGLAPVVGTVLPDSPAAVAGIRPDERIVAVNGQPVATWEGAVLGLLDALLDGDELRIELRGSGPDAEIRMTELRVDGRLSELTEPGALLPGLGLRPWSPTLPPVIGEVVPGGTAAAAGLRVGDEILSADDQPVSDWSDWVERVRSVPGSTMLLRVRREGTDISLPLTIGSVTDDSGVVVGRIGAAVRVADDLYEGYRAQQRYGAGAAFTHALERTWSMSVLTVRMVIRMVTGDVSVKNISGPINIAQYAGYSASVGLASFLNFLAVVSLSLGILNLLPIPVLDGGQVVYQVAEAVKGKPLSERAQILGQQIGIAWLVLVMSFAFYNDLSRLFS